MKKMNRLFLCAALIAVTFTSCGRKLDDGNGSKALVLLGLSLGESGESGEAHPCRWFPADNSAKRILLYDNKLYMSGNFTQVAANTPGVAIVNLTDGMLNPKQKAPVINNGGVRASAPDGQGGWYIAGSFTKINGQTRNRIARINSDGTLHAWNPDANGDVFALAVSGTTVYVGGDFTSFGGQARNRIAAFSAASGAVADWNPNANHSVNGIAISGNKLYAWGSFTAIGGQSRRCLAELDLGTGLAGAWNPNPTGGSPITSIEGMAISGSTAYVGGRFTSIGGEARNNLATIDLSTGLATAWNPGATGGVAVKAVSDNTVYVTIYGSTPITIGGASRCYIAALDATTGLATSWNPNPDGNVISIVLSTNRVYVCGGFTTIAGQARRALALFDAASGALTAANPNVTGSVETCELSGNAIYAGGSFTQIGGVSISNLAKLDAETGLFVYQ